jgi:hypothetical protein
MNQIITGDDALRAVDDCTECPYWVADAIRGELDVLREALADIYRGYDHNDNELYEALNNHKAAVSPFFCPACSWCVFDLGPELRDAVGQRCIRCGHLAERHDADRSSSGE